MTLGLAYVVLSLMKSITNVHEHVSMIALFPLMEPTLHGNWTTRNTDMSVPIEWVPEQIGHLRMSLQRSGTGTVLAETDRIFGSSIGRVYDSSE